MNKPKAILSMIMISGLFINCLEDNKSGGTTEIKDSNLKSDSEKNSLPSENVLVGPYVLNLVLSNKALFEYEIQIKDPSTDKIMAQTRAGLGTSPLTYYCDSDYFVLPVDPREGEIDFFGDPPQSGISGLGHSRKTI
jgi:hypothetical protein